MSEDKEQGAGRVRINERRCVNCGRNIYQTPDPNNIYWYHSDTGSAVCAGLTAMPEPSDLAPAKNRTERLLNSIRDAVALLDPQILTFESRRACDILQDVLADLAQRPVIDQKRIAEIRERQSARRQWGNPPDAEKWATADIDYLLSCIQPAEELTVEQALKELQSMTKHRCEIVAESTGMFRVAIWANSIVPLALLQGRHSTLSDCMSQVRAWAKSQTVEKKGS